MNETRYSLIERLRDKYDDDSWDCFVETYNSYIMAILRRARIIDADINDLLQHVLLNVWKGVSGFERRPGSRFRSWLSIVIRNSINKFYRRKRIQTSELENEYVSEDSELTTIIDQEWKSFIARKAYEEVEKEFLDYIMKIFWDSTNGMADAKVSEKYEVSESSVRVYRAKVKKALKQKAARLAVDLD